MTLIRRPRPHVFTVGDFVLYNGTVRGVVDTVCTVPHRVYYVSEWSGFGRPPRPLSVARYIAEGRHLTRLELPKRPLMRRR